VGQKVLNQHWKARQEPDIAQIAQQQKIPQEDFGKSLKTKKIADGFASNALKKGLGNCCAFF
jgi:hypothetical protein